MVLLHVNEGPPQNAPLYDLPPEYQRLHASSRGGKAIRTIREGCEMVAELLWEAEQADWAGLGSREAFIKQCLGRPVKTVELALDGVKLFDLSEPVDLD